VLSLPGTSHQVTTAGGVIATLGACTYVFGAPLIHRAHRHPGAAWGSFGLRLGLPIAGLALGIVADGGASGSHDAGLLFGPLLGAIAATAIDVGTLAYDAPPEDAATLRRRTAARGLGLTPAGGLRRGGGFDLGVAASF
jgi:hypothetical protein